MESSFRDKLAAYILQNARPVDKFGHQPRLYALTLRIGEGISYDDDVVYAAAWLHDLGVFIGHRPEELERLERWDHVQYTVEKAPAILQDVGFPAAKVTGVLDVIRTHQPRDEPLTIEATILRDADILEQLGAIGILRGISKVGRDSRFATFTLALANLQRSVDELPEKLRLESSRRLAQPKIEMLQAFLSAASREGVPDIF